MKKLFFLQAIGLFFGVGQSAPSAQVDVAPRDLEKRGPTCNTASNRRCWSDGFDITTDYEAKIPNTGVTRRYEWNITQHTDWVGGDGLPKDIAMLINGQFPGPIVKADWGDWVEVTVRNQLECEGTSIHWHGIRMLANAVNDGANGITECPLPPGATKTYRWRAEQYGTSWYHSHYSSQYANGLTGSIQIEGPASLNYEEDLGVFPITDWYYGDAEALQRSLIPRPGAAPRSDNVLFNGSHVNAQGGGEYYRVKLKRNKRHRLRLINPSVDNHFTVKLQNHDMTVIATDFVPVNSFTTSQIFMAPGQRYDVTIDASQTPGNYWFNVTFSGSQACGNSWISDTHPPAAIFQYDTVQPGTPTSQGTAPPDSKCEDFISYTPVVEKNVPRGGFSATEDNTLDVELVNKPWENFPERVYWNVHGSTMNITWEDPTLEYIAAGDLDFPERYNLHTFSGDWAYWIIENTSGIPHPMHLHGHDFYVLGRSPTVDSPFVAPFVPFNPATDISKLRFDRATRRDTTMMPAKGWVVLAFRADNPGAWLFHCHIAWHAGQGLSVQFLERVADIPGTVQLSDIEPVCTQWTEYYATSQCLQFDSGL
ncbi:related to Laccase-1 [Cephalotrichum gorgonifer]|uniref:laccase n=1 Tax=Cephalotrichum gorgonifer TaxID=2041049 RepID=A0AAE8MSM0_9PEZI|nr:related to Laccase-1 [Cephalotrichum gorgonifer]